MYCYKMIVLPFCYFIILVQGKFKIRTAHLKQKYRDHRHDLFWLAQQFYVNRRLSQLLYINDIQLYEPLPLSILSQVAKLCEWSRTSGVQIGVQSYETLETFPGGTPVSFGEVCTAKGLKLRTYLGMKQTDIETQTRKMAPFSRGKIEQKTVHHARHNASLY